MGRTAVTLHDVAVSSLRRRFRTSRSPLLVVAALLCPLFVPLACSVPDDNELRFLDRVRNEFPDLSVTRATDDRLLRLAQANCSPSTLSASDVEELRQIGVDRDRFEALALPLCPAR